MTIYATHDIDLIDYINKNNQNNEFSLLAVHPYVETILNKNKISNFSLRFEIRNECKLDIYDLQYIKLY